MDLGVLDFTLDPALIAQQPLSKRDASRMLVVERATGSCTHAGVPQLVDWLHEGDVLVVNDAEVIAARLHGRRPTGGSVEVLLIEPLDADGTWECIARGAGRIPAGETVALGPGLTGIWGERGTDVYRRIHLLGDESLDVLLQRVGELPLPPYIRRPDGPSAEDRERYQTMFARTPGAIAAPSAGLHFTPELVAELERRGVICVPITLIVGPATFLPVRTASLVEHSVPAERYAIPPATARAIADARADGRRVVAVGTTTVRALETVAAKDGVVRPGSGRTDLVIGPGHAFRAVDALFTNFHLPRSSLLALVAAFAGIETILTAYRAATASRYRFYSYGDAMLVV
jgi:S-adenosylmethionine:tRNA ribosyltransferase-isomerase